VLLAIVEVGGVPEVAAALGVADTTVRSHVSRLFQKTGTKRQADLVKLVAGYATPRQGDRDSEALVMRGEPAADDLRQRGASPRVAPGTDERSHGLDRPKQQSLSAAPASD